MSGRRIAYLVKNGNRCGWLQSHLIIFDEAACETAVTALVAEAANSVGYRRIL